MSTHQRTPSKLAEVARNPAAYLLIAIVGFCVLLIRHDANRDDRTGDCKEQLTRAQRREEIKDSIIFSLTRELMIKNQIIEEVPRTVDSLVNTRLP